MYYTCLYYTPNPVFALNHSLSAGIGRTGVLITMETMLTLLDVGRPVFPLDIVKTLRDQRAMMVQTTVQRNRTKLYAKKLGSYLSNDAAILLGLFKFFNLFYCTMTTCSLRDLSSTFIVRIF